MFHSSSIKGGNSRDCGSQPCAEADDDILLIEPLATVRPASVSAPVTSSSANVEADDNTECQGKDAATAIRKALPVNFTVNDLDNFRDHFNIPHTGEMRLPLKGEHIYAPIIDPFNDSGPDYARVDSNAVNRAPGQIRPVGWLTLTIFQVVCKIANIRTTICLFFNTHNASHSGYSTSFSASKGCTFFIKKKPGKGGEVRWHDKWCYVRRGMDENVLVTWTTLVQAHRPHFPATSITNRNIATLRDLFTKQYEYKQYCHEGALIQADLIADETFDPTTSEPTAWVEIIRAAEAAVPPNKVLFSTMTDRRAPLFQRIPVVKRVPPADLLQLLNKPLWQFL
ncbi:hypothetical protein LIER_02340 [Lithospermum erythrorhizon]|uniref:Uncharacterized protein n=1 Tax=Lithospermum erythrorhizon TaxID=34254 RepID=A0AAV3NSU8_LITER